MKWPPLVLCCALLAAAAASNEFPRVTTDKSVWPDQIYLAGTGVPDEAEVTLTVEGIGDTIAPMAIDLIFAIDVSGSMEGAPLETAKVAARCICMGLDPTTEQSGLVAFGTDAVLLSELSHLHWMLFPLIDSLKAGGWTVLGDAINLAQAELTSPRRKESNLPVILLLSDGSSTSGSDPFEAAQNAKASETLIYALGFGSPASEETLRLIVSEPDSETYWHYPDLSMIPEILKSIRMVPTYLAARHLSVIERLDSRFNYVPGSFSIVPDRVAGRAAEWTVGELGLAEDWSVTFRVTASDTGLLPVEVLPTSRANYMNFAGGWVDEPFPQEYIRVITGVGVAEGPVSLRSEDNILRLGPNPFYESCTISYYADGYTRLRLTIHDVAGRVVRTLVDGVPAVDMHSVVWTGDDRNGQQVPSGVYVCKYESPTTTKSKLLLLVR